VACEQFACGIDCCRLRRARFAGSGKQPPLTKRRRRETQFAPHDCQRDGRSYPPTPTHCARYRGKALCTNPPVALPGQHSTCSRNGGITGIAKAGTLTALHAPLVCYLRRRVSPHLRNINQLSPHL
jgi:hypothetical protein